MVYFIAFQVESNEGLYLLGCMKILVNMCDKLSKDIAHKRLLDTSAILSDFNEISSEG